MYEKYLKNRTSQYKSSYSQYKNILTSVIRAANMSYFGNQFNREKNNPKGTWKLINSLLCRSNTKANPSYFDLNGVHVGNDNDIADSFNDYFVNIGNKIATELPTYCRISTMLYLLGASQQLHTVTNLISYKRKLFVL